ncbi:Sec-independent protein translocase protein TatB [uncultured Cohaesibacter sp.]|uniref:Sec-independent protein translocase protein TatB n=1 Tax=uncultured Cohaesibacter sp. TaxID=1002546 RepID=UPI0029C93B59|nr:Sec-independent protein translocase protein TatB [uncultured Cohaesibacter sp.]
MFDIGWSEILVIVIITILVVGPKELPGLLRTVGKTIGNVRRMAGDFQNQFNEALREAELEDVKNTISDVRSLNPKTAVKDAVQKQLGFDDDFADELTEQVSKSGREINDALSDAEVKVKPADVDKAVPAETAAAAKVVSETASVDVPAEPAAKKPRAKAAAKPKTETAAKPRARAKKADTTAKAAPAKTAPAKTSPTKTATAKSATAKKADAEAAAPAKKPRRAATKTAATKAKSATAASEDKKASPSADDPSQKA